MKYNSKTVKQICDELEQGMTKKDAAILSGITEETFYQWMKKPEFSESVELAESKYIKSTTMMLNFKTGTEPTGSRALEILARRRPDEWGDKTKVQVSGDKDSPLEIKSTLDDNQKSIISEAVTEAVKKAFKV